MANPAAAQQDVNVPSEEPAVGDVHVNDEIPNADPHQLAEDGVGNQQDNVNILRIYTIFYYNFV